MLFLLFFIMQTRQAIQTCISKIKIKTPKEEWQLIKKSKNANSRKKTNSMSKDKTLLLNFTLKLISTKTSDRLTSAVIKRYDPVFRGA